METTTSEKPKKGMSGFSAFEIAISCLIFASYFMPLGATEFLGAGKSKIIFFFQFLSENPPVWLYFLFVLPVINVIVKQFYRTSWLSLLTIYAAYMPIMAIDGMGNDVWIQVKPTFGYYLQWVNIVLMGASILISWLIFWGKKCTNYKRLFIISGIMVVVAPIVGFLLAKLLGLWSIFAVLLPFNILGIPLLIVAIISFFINHKNIEKISKSNEGTDTENSNTSKPWLNKKTGMIVGGILSLVLIVLGISKCGGTENHFEVKVPTWEKFIMVTAEDVNLRKEANVNSDKLMSVYDGYGGCEFYWPGSKPKYYDGPLSDKNVHHLTPGFEILPVINEVGDWYQVYVVSLSATSDVEVAYIMKKYCQVIEPRKMDENAIQYLENNLNDKYSFLQSGKFKGYSLASLESDDVETYKHLKIGKVLENAMVYPEFATIIQKKEFKEGMDYTKPASVEGWAKGFYESKFSLGFYDEFSDLVNCKRFTDEMIEGIFGMFFENEFNRIKIQYLFDVKDDSRLETYTIDLNEYEHQLVAK